MSQPPNTAIGPDARFAADPEVVSRKIAGEPILVPIRGDLAMMERIFALNPVGEFVWSRLDGKNSLGQLAEMVEEEFETTRDQALQDVNVFVTSLVEQGIAVPA